MVYWIDFCYMHRYYMTKLTNDSHLFIGMFMWDILAMA